MADRIEPLLGDAELAMIEDALRKDDPQPGTEQAIKHLFKRFKMYENHLG